MKCRHMDAAAKLMLSIKVEVDASGSPLFLRCHICKLEARHENEDTWPSPDTQQHARAATAASRRAE